MPEGRPSLVHDLGLPLGIEVLPNLAHHANYLTLPRLQQGCIFFDEIEQVFFGLGREAGGYFFLRAFELRGQRAPQVVDLALQVFSPGLLALGLAGK